MVSDTPTEREVTTDRDRIESWAEEHDAAPVRHERGGQETIDVLPRSEHRDTHEEVDWDEFHQSVERDDNVVVYREDERRPFEVTGRQDVLGRSTADDDDLEERLVAGETVTATITETTVIEETIVEEATLESELVDRTPVQESIVDAELITREVDHCEVTDVSGSDTMTDETMFEAGYATDDQVMVEVEVDEGWTVTKEILDRLTVETRIVDTEATETDTVESDTIEESIDIEGVQETILEGDLLATEEKASDVIESGTIESEFREGDVVETTLLERQTVDEEMSVRKEFSGEIGNGQVLTADTISRETIERELAADEDMEAYPVDDAAVVEEEPVAGGGEENAVAEGDTTVTTDDTAVAEEETVVDADAEGGMEEPASGDRPIPTEAEEGKTVVDATGEQVGMVAEVENDTVFVDPHPSLTDRIRQVLDWGGHEEDAYPLQADHISRITDDEVQLSVEEETE